MFRGGNAGSCALARSPSDAISNRGGNVTAMEPRLPEKMFPDLCSEGVLEVYLDTFDENGIVSPNGGRIQIINNTDRDIFESLHETSFLISSKILAIEILLGEGNHGK